MGTSHGWAGFWGKEVCSKAIFLGREIFAKIDEEYLADEFNYAGMSKYVPNVKKICCYLANLDTFEESAMDEDELDLSQCAEITYGLLHARFIQTPPGMKQLVSKLFHL